MKTITIESFAELRQAVLPHQNEILTFFRGQGDVNWDLVPRAGRSPYTRADDDWRFEEWANAFRAYSHEAPRTQLEELGIAQHHGLATRLLDWTVNPLVAAFFAVWEDMEADAGIFVYSPFESWRHDNDCDPFSLEQPMTVAWLPAAFTTRLHRQQGVFTIHSPPTKKLIVYPDEELTCIRVPNAARNALRQELAYYGITRAALFPDLDGLANHLNWSVSDLFVRTGTDSVFHRSALHNERTGKRIPKKAKKKPARFNGLTS